MGGLQGTMVRGQEVPEAVPTLSDLAIYCRPPKLDAEKAKASDLVLKFHGIAKVQAGK